MAMQGQTESSNYHVGPDGEFNLPRRVSTSMTGAAGLAGAGALIGTGGLA